MAYTKTTWVDEVLSGAELFNIKESDNTPIESNVKIELATGITTAGTVVNADKMNNIEEGIEDLATGAARSIKGVAGASAGDVADIVAANDAEVLRRSGTGIGFGQLATAGIIDAAITAAKTSFIKQPVAGMEIYYIKAATWTDAYDAALPSGWTRSTPGSISGQFYLTPNFSTGTLFVLCSVEQLAGNKMLSQAIVSPTQIRFHVFDLAGANAEGIIHALIIRI